MQPEPVVKYSLYLSPDAEQWKDESRGDFVSGLAGCPYFATEGDDSWAGPHITLTGFASENLESLVAAIRQALRTSFEEEDLAAWKPKIEGFLQLEWGLVLAKITRCPVLKAIKKAIRASPHFSYCKRCDHLSVGDIEYLNESGLTEWICGEGVRFQPIADRVELPLSSDVEEYFNSLDWKLTIAERTRSGERWSHVAVRWILQEEL